MSQYMENDNYPGYRIYDNGDVYDCEKGKFLDTHILASGESVSLKLNGKLRRVRVDRLVAETYFPYGRIAGPDIRHRDGNVYNNRVDNLEWYRAPTTEEKSQPYKYRKVLCVETGEVYESTYECMEQTGLSFKTMRRCLNNKSVSTHDGLHFRWID